MRGGGFLHRSAGVVRDSQRSVRIPVGVCLVATLLALDGCAQLEPAQRGQLERGLIVVLPGVECYASHHVRLAQGLREAGIDEAIEIRVWGTHPFGTFPNLLSYQLNRKRAATLSEELQCYRKDHPQQPIALIGFSGGGAMALFTAEALPANFRLERIVLLGAAISPTYDLGPALARCERGIVNFYSPRDWFMIGLCTNVFGTMDRKNVSAAGRIGFRNGGGGLLDSPGLTQVAWRPEWRRLNNRGDHSGWRSHDWAKAVLARELMAGNEVSEGRLAAH